MKIYQKPPALTPHPAARSSRSRRVFSCSFAALALAVATPNAEAMPPWSGDVMQPGIGAASCAAPVDIPQSTSWVFGAFDLRDPSAPDYGSAGLNAPLWNPPLFHHPEWNVETMGNVYGIAIDSVGNIYTGAHGLYSKNWRLGYHHRYGDLGGGATDLAAAGTIYKLDATTGAPSVFAVLPQQPMNLGADFISGPGIGNIAYDPTNNQFFATNLEDGKIYCIDNTGTVSSSFDPLTPDNGAAGMPPRPERAWGINIFEGQAFYAMWNQGTPADPVKVRRVDILPGGFVPGTDVEVLTVPGSVTYNGGAPVADLTFSADGTTMILGERTMVSDVSSYNHGSAVHIAELSGSGWTVTRTLAPGNTTVTGEAYGGVAYGREEGVDEALIWMSSADTATSAGPHGLQGTRPADFPLASNPDKADLSYRVPYDPAATAAGPDVKGSGGDIEIMVGPSDPDGCLTFRTGHITCPEDPDASFEFDLGVTNLSGQTAFYALLTPCPDDSLPAGAETAQPTPGGVITLAAPIPHGASTVLNIGLPGFSGGETVCFRVTLLNETGGECCTDKLCVELPDCGCSALVDSKVDCRILADGTVKYLITLTVQNNTHLTGTPHDFVYATFLPPAGIDPSLVNTDPNPIPPGGTGTVTTCYFGDPGELCFNLGLHDADLIECCSLEDVCVIIPECETEPPADPDFCRIDRAVVCNPRTGTATVNYTICNNSASPRTYDWIATAITNPHCDAMFDTSDFAPATGTIGPVPAGGCVTTSVVVSCDEIRRGDCAALRICARPRDVRLSDEDLRLLCCESIVRNRGIIIEVPTDDPTFPVTPSYPVCFVLTNTTGEPVESAEFRVYTEDGSLSFSEERETRDDIAAPFLIRSLSFEPDEQKKIIIYVTRQDLGSRPAAFTSLIADLILRGDTLDTSGPLLSLAYRLTPEVAAEDRPAEVEEVSAATEDNGNIKVTVKTERNVRYQLQKSTALGSDWTGATCTVGETPIAAGGTFMGTGDAIRAYVPCSDDEKAMFFRVVTEPTPAN